MLIQFNFKNFKSFRDEATLDLSAAKMTEFSDRVVTVGSEKILPVAAIYGANASGKSNIYNAFEYMSDYVVDSFKYGDEEEKFEEFRPTPFLFDSTSASAESGFEVYFILPGSAGTLKMFALYPELQEVLEKGSVFFIDELNARLHPLLVRNFLLTFLNPEINTNHAQLVFTTHDTWQLSNQLLRPDEIWFVEKDERGVSTLYSLADFVDEAGSRIRKDESYEKNYLLGKYGAIPTLKSIDIFKED